MTRINIIDPLLLSNKHLFAEYRELPRIFSYVEKHGIPTKISSTYTLGTGHVKFFTIRLNWLLERYELLYNKLLLLGYNLNYTPTMLQDKYEHLLIAESMKGDIEYYPTEKEIQINLERIKERTK
jgi:deoxyribonuclease (pyrimidine dimer)